MGTQRWNTEPWIMPFGGSQSSEEKQKCWNNNAGMLSVVPVAPDNKGAYIISHTSHFANEKIVLSNVAQSHRVAQPEPRGVSGTRNHSLSPQEVWCTVEGKEVSSWQVSRFPSPGTLAQNWGERKVTRSSHKVVPKLLWSPLCWERAS